jgi:death-on-curing protein
VKEPEGLLRDVVLALHERLLAEFGGPEGVRDESLLDSALGKARNSFAYGSPSLCDLAATYAYGIIRNHPFVDGNKRTGFVAAAVFLEINGRTLVATEAEAVVRTLALAAGELTENGFAEWLESSSRPA